MCFRFSHQPIAYLHRYSSQRVPSLRVPEPQPQLAVRSFLSPNDNLPTTRPTHCILSSSAIDLRKTRACRGHQRPTEKSMGVEYRLQGGRFDSTTSYPRSVTPGFTHEIWARSQMLRVTLDVTHGHLKDLSLSACFCRMYHTWLERGSRQMSQAPLRITTSMTMDPNRARQVPTLTCADGVNKSPVFGNVHVGQSQQHRQAHAAPHQGQRGLTCPPHD